MFSDHLDFFLLATYHKYFQNSFIAGTVVKNVVTIILEKVIKKRG